MLSQLYRNVLLALRRSFSRSRRNKITKRWLDQSDALLADAEAMSPVPLPRADASTTSTSTSETVGGDK